MREIPNIHYSHELSDKFRQMRKMAGLTQMELAEKANIDWKTVNRLENEKGCSNIGVFFDLAQALNITPNDLAPDCYHFNQGVYGIKDLNSRFQKLSPSNQSIFLASVNALLDGFIAQQKIAS